MNERLKELAAKSNFGHMENNEVVYDHRLEKFAELIVKECADIAIANGCGDFVDIEQLLLEHFGVKE